MRIFTAGQIRYAEKLAVERFSMNYLGLMENAGTACAEKIMQRYDIASKKTTVVCGSGKNGGDGFVIARKLSESGGNISVVLASGEPKASDAIEMMSKIQNMPITVTNFKSDKIHAVSVIEESDYIVDAVFGIGFRDKPDESMSELFGIISNAEAKVISIDVPSGTECDNGKVGGACVKADCTIAISVLKTAHVLFPANSYCGKTDVVSIGMPEECFASVECNLHAIDDEMVKGKFLPRDSQSNKGNFGHILSVCGSYNMPGAASLAANGAVSSGAGMVTAAFPFSAYPSVTSHLVEPLLLPLFENEAGTLSKKAIPKILEKLKKVNVCLVGCGLGLNEDTKEVVYKIIKNAKCTVVIDADGINAVACNIDILKAAKAPVVMTPHPGEMARLISATPSAVQNSRLDTARNFADKYGVTLVLKGANTIIASPNEKTYINRSGNAGMAQAGSGDLLSGILSAFIAQGMSPVDAAVCAVYLHGRAGDKAAENLSQRGMTPTSMIGIIPKLLSEYEQ